MILPCTVLMQYAMIKPSLIGTDNSFTEGTTSDALAGTVEKTEIVNRSFQLTKDSSVVQEVCRCTSCYLLSGT